MRKEYYIEAFCKCFQCKKEDIELKQRWENGPYLCKYKNEYYSVDHYSDIVEQAKAYLESYEEASIFPVWMWIEIVNDVHLSSDFYNYMVLEINKNIIEKDERNNKITVLNSTLNVNKTANNSIAHFWNTLSDYDEDLYGMGVIASSKIYNQEALIDEMAGFLIDYGDEYLKEIKNGLYEMISLNNESEEQLIIIYSVDSIKWEND